ncbi:MAG: lipoate--protein ligase family protein [Candidatus Coatesbacteria bacterium]|nr:MAG: lipoate--protein ligase family protein [Candidatus Coatesbacteria bacterium]
MRLIVEEGYSPAENMARDEALFQAFRERGEPVWRIYAWDRPAATFGRLQPYPGKMRFAVVRRLTGGGIVPHGADLTYCVVRERRRGRENYRSIIEPLAEALRTLGIGCEVWEEEEKGAAGRCFASLAPFDIHVGGRKLAGCAQYRTRNAVMHHGSVANSVPPAELAPLDVWDAGSSITIEEALNRRLTPDDFAGAVGQVFTSLQTEIKRGDMTKFEERTADGLIDKYSSDAWNEKALWEP